MRVCISDLLLHVDKQPHPFHVPLSLSRFLLLSLRGRAAAGPATTRSKRDLLPYQWDQTAACQRKARQKEGEMKDGNMDEMEGCDGQGHVTMEILQQHDVVGDCCD